MVTESRASVRRLFVSRLISLTGSAAAFIGLNVSIYQRTHSTMWLAATLLLTFGVEGISAPFAGVIGDRFDRRKVMIVSDLAGAAIFLAMALVHSPGILLPLAFCAALAESPFIAASTAAMPNLVTDDDLAWANGMLGVSRNAGIVLGPVIGGVMVGTIGAGWVFAVNAVSFVVSAMLVASIHRSFSGDRTDEPEFHGLRAGFQYLWRDWVLRTLTFAWLVMVFGLGMTMVADLPFVNVFHAGSLGYGVLVAFWGAGSIAGSLAARRLRAQTEPPAMVFGLGVVAIMSVLSGLSPWFGFLLVTILLMGIADGVSQVADQGIMQRRSPDAVRSRVSGAMDSFIHTGLALSFLIGGPMVSAFGPRTVYIVGGVAAFAGAVVGIPLLKGVPVVGHSPSEKGGTASGASVGTEPVELLRP
jgi:MFS family permease